MTVLSIYLLCHRRRPEGISIQSVVKVAVYFWGFINHYLGCADRDENSWAAGMTIFPSKWRANQEEGRGWAPTSSVLHRETPSFLLLLGGVSCYPTIPIYFLEKLIMQKTQSNVCWLPKKGEVEWGNLLTSLQWRMTSIIPDFTWSVGFYYFFG